jgi:hypothetical protein
VIRRALSQDDVHVNRSDVGGVVAAEPPRSRRHARKRRAGILESARDLRIENGAEVSRRTPTRRPLSERGSNAVRTGAPRSTSNTIDASSTDRHKGPT